MTRSWARNTIAGIIKPTLIIIIIITVSTLIDVMIDKMTKKGEGFGDIPFWLFRIRTL